MRRFYTETGGKTLHTQTWTAEKRAMTKIQRLLTGLLLIFLIHSAAEAKVFRNAYVSFELPEKWNCTLEQTEWVCRTSDPGLAEAVIILTAKETGPQDALPAYESHLKTPRTILSRTGQNLPSTVYKVEQRNIANHTWIDGMHFGSEVNNYYTRYLATTKDRIAVLITLSAHKLHYSKYSADFFRVIESLRVIATRSLMNGNGANGSGMGGDLLGGSTATDMMPTEPGAGLGEDGSGGGSSASKGLLAMALIIGGVGAYLLIKRKQKDQKKKR